ncbi:MAG TPA: hypothetical protein VK874_05295 [Gaiellaceae bacterium]|nr:hypothetical protein [Gaiellaceae bacterium]
MSNAGLFALAAAVGAALLAVWVDTRFPGLAPAGLARRMLALVAGCVVMQGAPTLFGGVLGTGLEPTLRSLAALGVLLPALTIGFLTALWLLRSLQGLGAMR